MTVSMAAFAEALRSSGVDYFTGVPCSQLESLISFAAGSDGLSYVAAASEGEAIGLAAGAWLSGRMPMVLTQNSGLGNCINPLTSLSHTYGLPLLLMVSHRARDGKDAPQHLLMGEKTYALLEAIGVAHLTLSDDEQHSCELLAQAATMAQEGQCPVALVLPAGTFENSVQERELTPKRVSAVEVSGRHAVELAPRIEALQAVDAALSPRDLLVATTGMTSRELFSLHDRPQNFYMMGSMGCALSIALGVAGCRPTRKIVVLDGDGAFLMKLGTAATVGHYRPGGLLHVVLDNGTYESTGGQPTVSSSVSFEGVAAAVGYRRSIALESTDALTRLVRDFRPVDGPVFATLRIADGHLESVGRVGRTPQAIRDDFRESVLDELLVS